MLKILKVMKTALFGLGNLCSLPAYLTVGRYLYLSVDRQMSYRGEIRLLRNSLPQPAFNCCSLFLAKIRDAAGSEYNINQGL